MKIRSSIIIIIISLLPAVCQAQDLNNKILITVGGNEIQSGEFIRMYKKSLEPGKSLDIDGYLQQYIVFKLKVADALKEGYDTTMSFRNELNGYRNQLAQNYLTDTQTKEKLLRSAYQRSLTEINGWHILIALPQEASPEDTLKAWKKASDIRERIIKGESFEQVARGTSDDQSVKVNGGNLGYFTVFQMIMPFEDAAYSLKKGAISMPVRTPYGYHIIKVTDKRPSKGRIKVAHIMKAAPPGTGEKEDKQAEEEINNIYKKIQEGTSFGELAKEYSDHKESSVNGGELNWFGTGEIISDFSEAAFSLIDTGKFTKPVRTVYGWHIIKLLDRKAPGSFEESKSYLESKINQSYLNSISKKTFVEKLKKEYKFKINQIAYNWFVKNTDTLIIQGLKKYDRTNMPAENLYSFANQYFTAREFANYIEKRGSMVVTKDSSIFINRSIETRAADHLISYENSVLEKKFPDFRYLMNEFHDGILLFEISGKKVWNSVNDDSLGLRNYYEDHKNSYLTRRGIDAKIYTLKSSKGEKLLSSAYKKYFRRPDTDNRLIEKFNKKNDTLLIIKEGTWLKGDDHEIDNIQWITGSQSFTKDGFPSIIFINKVIDPFPLKFEEVQGEMMSGYQEYLESEWIKQLKEKYSFKVDSLVLEEVKKKLNNE
ncbi:MAG: peptidylprolyl isomerase [Bacteroidia bacterium]|nr:peptidylprolyl isomerase [Bacteroidia bacterium]